MKVKLISLLGLILAISIGCVMTILVLVKTVETVKMEHLEEYSKIVRLSLIKHREEVIREAESIFEHASSGNVSIAKDAKLYVVDDSGKPLDSTGKNLKFSEDLLFHLMTGDPIPAVDVEDSRLLVRVIKASDFNFDRFFVYEKDATNRLNHAFSFLSLHSDGLTKINGAVDVNLPDKLVRVAKSSWNPVSGMGDSNGRKTIVALSPFLDHMNWYTEGIIITSVERSQTISKVSSTIYLIVFSCVALAAVLSVTILKSRKETLLRNLRVSSLCILSVLLLLSFLSKQSVDNFVKGSIHEFFDQLKLYAREYVKNRSDVEELTKTFNFAALSHERTLLSSALVIRANLKKQIDRLGEFDFNRISHTLRGLKLFTTHFQGNYLVYLPIKTNTEGKGLNVFFTVFILCVGFGLFLLDFLVRNAENKLILRKTMKGYLFLLPGLSMFALWLLIPIVFSLYLSFHEWTMVDPLKPFLGFENFSNILKDDALIRSLKNTLVYTLNVPIGMAISLGVALLMNKKIKGINLLRLLYFLPSISSFVAISMVWQWIYNPEFGLLNYLLSLFKIPPQRWLSDPKTAMLSIIIMTVWMNLGYQMVIYLAGLKGIPNYLYEVAALDGANSWQKFWHITLPMLQPTTVFLLITSVIGSFQVFTPIYVMTQGGPAGATNVFVYHIYNTAWKGFRMGYASAQSWFLFILIFVASFIQFRLMGKTFYEE
ncbi:carbohydrate ABC transporter permease [Pseudothermotoga sp.]